MGSPKEVQRWKLEHTEAVLPYWMRPALDMALGLGVADASPAIPTNPGASPTEIAEVNQVLEANGYTDIAVLSGDDQIVTASAIKDGKKSVVDVDPITGIILPHIDLPPMPAQLASVADLTQTRAGGRR
jgi:hypothetical protein